MGVVRSLLVAAALLQVALLPIALLAVRSIPSRSMRVGVASGVIGTAIVTAAVLVGLWPLRSYGASHFALAVFTCTWSVAETGAVWLLVRYVRESRQHGDELRAAADALVDHRDDLQRSHDFYLRLFDDFPALIRRSDAAGQCDYFNRSWLEFRGRTIDEERGDGWMSGIHPDDFERCMAIRTSALEARKPFDLEYRLLNAKGEYRWIADCGRPFFDLNGEYLGFIGSCYDITVSKDQAGQLAFLAGHDILTGLANRRVLQSALERALARAHRDVPSILLHIDVDHFRAINDRMGHPAGDAALISVARLLVAGVRTTDVVARLGGDEFAVLLEMIGTEEAVAIAQRLVSDAREQLSGTGLSIGVASMADVTDIAEVMRRADERMYEAKSGGGSRVVVDIRAIRHV